jgi:predicted dienelactone hydrolase
MHINTLKREARKGILQFLSSHEISSKGKEMTSNKKTSITVIVLVVLFILFLGAKSRPGQGDETPVAEFDIPPYAEVGPYKVGLQYVEIERDDPLGVTVWYPADSTEVQDISYSYEIKLGKPLGKVAIAQFDGQAVEDPSFNLSEGPYPLVVLSPGFSIGSSAYAWLAEHLASYGFVVVSPEHQEHLNPEDQLWRSAITRPQDILSLFSFLDDEVKPGGQFEGLVNTDIAAVVGHSYGGYTTLAAAGAQIDPTGLQTHCQKAIAEEHPAAWMCDMLLSHQNDMAELAGQDPDSNELWLAIADARVDAIVPMAGDAFFFGQEGLTEIKIPVMAIGGTADEDSPFSWSAEPVYDYASSQTKVLIAYQDVEHMEFTADCETIPVYMKLFSGEFCSDASFDRVYIHALTKHFTTAFLLSELGGDLEAAEALSPQKVDFVGVEYAAQGFGE